MARTIIVTQHGKKTEFTGPIIDWFWSRFHATLTLGNSADRRINRFPKTYKKLVENLNKSVRARGYSEKDIKFELKEAAK